MSKYVADKIADKLFPGITKWMKKNKLLWHEKLSKPYDKTMHPWYGLKHTKETKKLLSKAASKRKGKKNPFYGKKHNLITKTHWSILRSGNKICASYGFKGKKHSEKSKKKTSRSLMGRTYSAQSIALMSQKRKEYWERKRNENGI